MKNHIKRTTAMLLALVLCLTAFLGPGIPAAQAAEQWAEVRNIQFPREGDDNYDAAWGHPALKYRNGWETKASGKNIIRAMESYSGTVCYCIEPGVIQNTGDTFVSRGDDFWDTIPDDLNHTLSGDEIRTVIGRILQYGYTGKVSTSWYSQNETDANCLANLLATQLLVWETIVGERDLNFNHVAPGDGYDCVAEYIAESHPLHDRVFSYYDSIVSKVKKHTTIPSFCGKEYSLAWDGERYSVTLTDSNGILDQYAFSAGNEAVKTSRSGNTLTIYTRSDPGKAVTITATRLSSFRKGLVVWTDGTFDPDGGTQDMVSFAESVSDPVSGSFTVKLGIGTLKLYKTSEDDNIAGLTFTITGNGQTRTVTTNENGEIILKDLTPGTYTVTEQSHDLYEPQESKTVTIVSGETATVNFNNTLRRGSLEVTKTSDDGLVEGVKFRLTGTAACGLGIEEYAVTDASGKARFENIPIGSGYVLAEVDTPSRYEVPDALDVTIEWNTVTEKSVHNTLKLARIRISKTGEVFASVHCDSDIYVPIYAEQALAGAVFEIAAAEDITSADGTVRHAAGEVVDTITTDENGSAVSKELYPGKYTVREIQAPGGTVLNTEPQTVDLTENADGEITEVLVSFSNIRQKVAVTVKKQLEQNKNFGIGLGSEIASVTFGLYAAEELTAADGSVIPADGLMDLLTIGQAGKATCTADLPLGSYYLLELTTDEHYLLSQDKYPFTFAYAGQEIPLVEITVNEGEAITNTLRNGKILGIKKDANGNTLAGAVIGIFHPGETEYSTDTAILTTVSAEDGSFSFPSVPFGSWVIREIAAPEGYLLTDESFPVTVSEDGQVIVIEIVNEQITGSVKLTKVDRDYPENKLTGAEFQVWADTNGDELLTEEDILFGSMVETEAGIYELFDLPYGGYFVKETKAPDGFQLDENAYHFKITENGQTVIVENEAGKGFLNNAQRGSIRIEKSSDDGVIQGFTFKVEGTDFTGQPYSQTFVTDEKGEIQIEGLRIGTYTISEVKDKASERYELPPDETVTLQAGMTTVVKCFNKSIQDGPDIPKTSDESNIALWGTVALAALAGAGVVSFVLWKKSRRK
jgi:hypothetical protein